MIKFTLKGVRLHQNNSVSAPDLKPDVNVLDFSMQQLMQSPPCFCLRASSSPVSVVAGDCFCSTQLAVVGGIQRGLWVVLILPLAANLLTGAC